MNKCKYCKEKSDFYRYAENDHVCKVHLFAGKTDSFRREVFKGFVLENTLNSKEVKKK